VQRRGELTERAQRVGEALFLHVAVDVGVERVLAGISEPRFGIELRDVEAPAPERVERAGQRTRLVGNGEDHRGLAVRGRSRGLELAGDAFGLRRPEEHEARRVVGMVGDRPGELDEPVALGGDRRADGGAVLLPRCGDLAGRDRGIADRHAPDIGKRIEEAAALGQHDRMRLDLTDVGERGPEDADEPVLHPPRDLRERVELVLGEDVVPFADRPGDRVVDWQQADVGASGDHRVGDGPVRRAAHRRKRDAAPGGVRVEDDVRIRPLDPLESGGHRQLRGRGLGRGLCGGHHDLLRSGRAPRPSIGAGHPAGTSMWAVKSPPPSARGLRSSSLRTLRHGLARRRAVRVCKKAEKPKTATQHPGHLYHAPQGSVNSEAGATS
jgi:hypothetical protein